MLFFNKYISKDIEKIPCRLFLGTLNGLSAVLVQFAVRLTSSYLYKCHFVEELMNVTATVKVFISIPGMQKELLMKPSLFNRNHPFQCHKFEGKKQ